MATWFSFTYRGQKFEAKATSRSTRSGFAHDVVIKDENYDIVAQETRHYLNRTWESYRFESCLHGAIDKANIFYINSQTARAIQKDLQKRQIIVKGRNDYNLAIFAY